MPKRKTLRKKKVMNGGVIFSIHISPIDVFLNFIKYSDVELLTSVDSSVYGIILKATIKPGIVFDKPEMNYWRLDTQTLLSDKKEKYERVTSLCIKIGFVHEQETDIFFLR